MWGETEVSAYRAGDPGPLRAALDRMGCWTTLHTHPGLWTRVLDHTVDHARSHVGALDAYRTGARRLAERRQSTRSPGSRGPRHQDRAKWRDAWGSCGEATDGQRFFDCARDPILRGARQGARRSLRLDGIPAPPSQVREFVRDLNLDLPVLLSRGGPAAGWRDIAATALARGPTAFVQLQRVWGSPAAHAVAGELTDPTRTTASTLAVVWPHTSRLGRAVAAGRLVRTHPDGLQALAELHAWLRAGATGRGAGSHGATVAWDRSCSEVKRAVMASPPADLVAGVLALPELAVASAQAAYRYGHRRADASRERGLFDDLAPLVTPCPQPPPLPAPADLRTWILLAVLRGQIDALLTWAGYPGGRPAEGGSWHRVQALLPGPAHPTHSRLAVALDLPEALEAWRPWLALVSRLPTDRRLRARVEVLLRPCWSPAVPLPARGFPAMVTEARRFLLKWNPEILSLLSTRNLPDGGGGASGGSGRLSPEAPRRTIPPQGRASSEGG